MFRIILLTFGLAVSTSAMAEAQVCLNLFTLSTLEETFIYTAIHNTQSKVAVTTQPSSATIIVGRAEFVGKEAGIQTRSVATLDFTVKGDLLTISAARIPTDFTGEGIYRQLLEKVLQDNPTVTTIMTSLTGSYYKKFLNDFNFVDTLEITSVNKSSLQVALELSAVYGELAKLGFTQIRSATVLETRGEPYLRFSVQR